MAYASDIRTNDSAAARGRIATLFAALAAHRAKARLYRTTLRELQSLSRRELNDLGIAPSNLRSIAYEASYGKE